MTRQPHSHKEAMNDVRNRNRRFEVQTRLHRPERCRRGGEEAIHHRQRQIRIQPAPVGNQRAGPVPREKDRVRVHRPLPREPGNLPRERRTALHGAQRASGAPLQGGRDAQGDEDRQGRRAPDRPVSAADGFQTLSA